jgi:DNA invertase Pin-like site-specific DNA recombinase
MIVKYNRVSSITQTGERFKADSNTYDKVILDKVSGTIPFKDRQGGKEIVKLVESGKLKTLVLEELSRAGRTTGDVINTLQWLDDHEVNVIVRNIGLESRPDGKKNPIWNLITSVMSSLYQMELENIKERTQVGRMMYLNNGGTLGRPIGTSENTKSFLSKPKNKEILKYISNGYTAREIAKIVNCSTTLVTKVRKLADAEKL